MNKYEKALIDNLNDLVDAFHSVLNAIEEGDDNTEDCYSELISEGYPFKESFDELFLKVIDWRDTVKDLININDNNNGKENKNITKAKEIYKDIKAHLNYAEICTYYILDTTDKYRYALVIGIDTDMYGTTDVYGKIACQPVNSLLQCDYCFDWLFPVYNDYNDIDYNQISVASWRDVLYLLVHYYKFREYYFKYE